MFAHLTTLTLALTTLLPFPLTRADSAPGFPIRSSQQLIVYFDYSDHYVDDDNDNRHLTATDALYSPELFTPSNSTADQTYLVIMVDPDAPDNGTKVQLLQWLQPNLRGTPRFLREDATAQNSTNNAGAFYYPPSPPDNSGRHYYTLLLYIQPEGWDVPEKYASFSPPANLTSRAPFNVTDFVGEAGLGRYLVASNYFYVDAQNTSSSE